MGVKLFSVLAPINIVAERTNVCVCERAQRIYATIKLRNGDYNVYNSLGVRSGQSIIPIAICLTPTKMLFMTDLLRSLHSCVCLYVCVAFLSAWHIFTFDL